MNPQFFLEKAEEYLEIVRQGGELVNRLQAIGDALMAIAVEIETKADRAKNAELNRSDKAD